MTEDKDQTTGRDMRAQAWGALVASIFGVFALGLSGILGIAFGREVLASADSDAKSLRLARTAILLGWLGIGLGLIAITYFLISRML